MEDAVFIEALSQARRELDDLIAQRAKLDAKISRVKNTVDALAAQVEGEKNLQDRANDALRLMNMLFDDSTGITDAIRDVLRQSKTPLTAPQIREALEARSFDTNQYSAPLTVIHNTVNRLVKQGEVEPKHNSLGVFIGWVRKPSNIEILAELLNKTSQQPPAPSAATSMAVDALLGFNKSPSLGLAPRSTDPLGEILKNADKRKK
jgi:hypothetical protein